MTTTRDEDRRSYYFEIFAISLAVIILEIAYTRIFSFKVYYYFTYLIIGLSLLGLGTGGVLVAIFVRLREARLPSTITACGVAASTIITGGYFVTSVISLSALGMMSDLFEMSKLALVAFVLFLPFCLAGIVIASLFANRSDRISRLYAADLLGAGLGCTVSIPLIGWIGPPACVLLSALIFALAGLRLSPSVGSVRTGAAVVAALMAATLVSLPKLLPDPTVDPSKELSAYRKAGLVVYSRWSPVFRIDVAKHPFHPRQSYVIQHDGQLGSKFHRFDGDLSKLGSFRHNPRSYPFAVLGDAPRVLVIGAAGGHEVLASLYFGASHVTGVELNPVTVGLLRGRFADFTGHLGENERVTLVRAEGRSFLKRTAEKYDLIWLVAPDSYAAMNAATSGAFVLSESYLYTVEMVNESLRHLRAGGVLCAQFGELNYERKPNRTVRYVGTVRRALAETGSVDFAKRVLVATVSDVRPLALSTVLVGRERFSATQIAHFLKNNDAVAKATVRYAPGRALDGGPVSQLVTLETEKLEEWYDHYKYDVRPVFDDSPFFWHFARFRDTLSGPLNLGFVIDWEDSIGERVLAVLLVFVTLFATVFLLLPFVTIREVWRKIPWKVSAGVYFAALGMGFMFLEVCLIQMLTLFLGYPTYSLSVTLFGLLVFTGIGSLASDSYGGRRNGSLGVLLGVLSVMVVFYQLGMPVIIDRFVGASLALRITIAVAMIAPLGVCLGGFMPIGLRTVAALSPHPREYVAWAWAVNGFFSVITSILSTILAMTIGFRMVFLVALAVYVIGIAALARVPAPSSSLDV